jgi:hypothetical protein
MAALWHYQRLGSESEPIRFHDLVALVRTEQLAADDLVREDWNPEWRPAALAVGLFHMAGREDLVARWEAEQAELRRRAEEELAAAQARDQQWSDEEFEAGAEFADGAMSEEERELVAQATRSEIDATLAAALAEVEARERALEPTRWQRLRQSLASPALAQGLLHWLPTLALPNLLAWWILRWSNLELQRFPTHASLTSANRPFPLWGTCDPSTYFFLLFDVMIFAGAATYLAVRLAERYADD